MNCNITRKKHVVKTLANNIISILCYKNYKIFLRDQARVMEYFGSLHETLHETNFTSD